MTYDEAEKMVADNLHLTSEYSKIPAFPFYLRHLFIAPIGADSEVKSNVYNACLTNGFNNKDALDSLGLTGKDYEVLIMGFDGKFTSPYPLEKYLEELQYKS